MTKSKTDIFPEETVRLADIAKALSHPTRIQILQILKEKNICICGEIVDLLPLSQSTVSQHLKELKRVGLIEGDIDGPRICYCLNKKVLEEAEAAFSNLFSKICKC
jgi:DNA-binding transcriptional ArsR family regulator